MPVACHRFLIAPEFFQGDCFVVPRVYILRVLLEYFLITGDCQLRFSQFTIRNSLVVPGLGNSRVYPESRIEACNCLLVFFEFFEGNAFVEPCSQ